MDDLRIKKRVAELWKLGAFGNKLPSWATPGETPPSLRESGRFSLRSYAPGGRFIPNMPFRVMADLWSPQYYVCTPAPDEFRIVQGELLRDVGGLLFTHSFEPCTLREALLKQDGTVKQMHGFAVNLYLQSVCSPESYIEIMDNLDFGGDGAIVEFTVFNRFVGDRPGRNTIIWELRKY